MLSKSYLVMILLMAHCYQAWAVDPEQYYVVDASITLKNGDTLRGCFRLPKIVLIEKDTSGYYYTRGYRTKGDAMRLRPTGIREVTDNTLSILPTDYHFHNNIKRGMQQRPLQIFPSMYLIQGSKTFLPVFLGAPISLIGADIADVTVRRIYWGFHPYIWVVAKLTPSDETWIHTQKAREELLGGIEACEYKAMFLYDNDHDNDIRLLIEDIKKELGDYFVDSVAAREQLERVDALAEQLRQKHVLIFTICVD